MSAVRALTELMMIELTHFDVPPEQALRDQIQLICVEHFSELSALPLPESNPLRALYQYVLGLEVHRYLERMHDAHHARPQLVTLRATGEEQLAGFALYLPFLDNPEAAALLYAWVRPQQRGQGLGARLLAAISQRYPYLQLACRATQADYFSRQGFHTVRAHGPQVLLSNAPHHTHGILAIEPLEPIFATKEAQLIQQYLLKQHGVHALKYAYAQRDRSLQQLAQQAQRWFAEHPPQPD